ncbi:alpha-2-macroglobulin family protein [Stenotrophobium rhamnosiphilum]|uniref:Alpha-2-macroglobulin n=1 Tax=Stenotrophobium rhamnosiphilum TaxID=2029166 RepID=A0A2T5MEB2_9GAMM|nr:MG2 domain-containing protein [Stenotrophobium rhamnosiphilum]PTU30924.1 hypothetical protein CJD38_11475 [Stenotrophobium rhamnosiphilum]
MKNNSHLVALCALLFPLVAFSAQVETFSPQGEIKKVRQVAARFSEDVVKFGDPRLAAPFKIDCSAAGAGRWADGRNWVYDFKQDMPAGISCQFTVLPDFKDLSGSPLTGDSTFSFNTGGPAIVRALPSDGDESIDENQIFILSLDAAATSASVGKNAWCEVDGVNERIPVRVLRDQERKKVLAQRRLLGYEYLNLFIVRDADGQLLGRGKLQTQKQLDDGEKKFAVVQCRRRLPAAHQISLVWGKGIATSDGVQTSDEQRFGYQVRPEFTARFNCQRANTNAGCLPMLPVSLSFSAPISRNLANGIALVAADGTQFKPEAIKEDRVEAVTFKGPFAERAKYKIVLPLDIKDDAGRKLSNAKRFPLEVATDEAPPLAKFSGQFGILELNEGGVLPVSLRNLDGAPKGAVSIAARSRRIEREQDIYEWISRIRKATQSEWSDGGEILPGTNSVLKGDPQAKSLPVIKPLGARAFEVAPIDLKNAGLYVVELESPKLGQALHGKNKPYYVPTMALVTDLSVHFQWGLESSSVWVTRLHDGSSVSNATVSVFNACSGAVLWKGQADRNGIARITESLPPPRQWVSCTGGSSPELLVSAREGSDFSFVLSSWNEGIAPSDFGNIASSLYGDAQSYNHTVLDRALYHAGETVSMKHYVREPTSSGLRLPKAMPNQLVIMHEGSGKTFELPLKMDAIGIGENQWVIPKDAPLGIYQMSLKQGNTSINSGQFRVEQFKLPTARAQIQIPKAPLVAARSATLDLQVNYLSGGGAANLPVKLRTLVQPRAVSFKHYDEFSFGGEAVREGLVETSEGGAFDEFDDQGTRATGQQAQPAQTIPLTLDKMGAARVTAPIPLVKSAQELLTEMEYSDPNGQILTVARRVPLWPSAVTVGLKTEGWVSSSDNVNVRIAVLNTKGVPLSKVPVNVEVFQQETHSYRKRLIGGFYSYAHTRKIKRLPMTCAATSDELGMATCHFAPGVSGEIVLQAKARDAKGKETRSVLSVWVAGKDDWWFSQQANDRMDLLPEKKEYQPDEVARFQVRMPFRSANALVTVEREGVLEQFVTKLDGEKPIIEVPLKGSYAPNVFVSVLAVRGRPTDGWLQNLAVAARGFLAKLQPVKPEPASKYLAAPPTSLTDLSRPAFRLGIANISVGLKAHRLQVDVSPDKPTYQIRDKATVVVTVKKPDGQPAKGGEIAFAAVDDALLELQPNDTWNILQAMMAPRPLSVLTSTAQLQVVGKRQYGRKTAPPGGGGGRSGAREVFDTLLLWKGRVKLDNQGQATIPVPLNDALTSFRLVAVASLGTGQFGTGTASIRTHQDLELVPAMPVVVREGDQFRAAYTVRNATNAAMHTSVNATMQGNSLPERVLDIPAGEAREASWDITVPINSRELVWEVRANAGAASDRVKTKQTVMQAYPVRVYQATLTQLDKPYQLFVQRPEDAVPGRGGIHVELMSQLGGSLDGVRDYMGVYPWNCIEQRLSRAIAMGDAIAWESVKSDMPVFLDRDGLLRYYPAQWLDGSDALTAYVLAITHEKKWEIAADPRKRMIDALQAFVQGRLQRGNPLNREDQTERKLAALEALARYDAVQPEWVNVLQFQPNLLPTSALLDWIGVLQRVQGIEKGDERLKQALQILRSRINFQGTIMTFSTERDDAWWWLMASADRNANIAVLRVLNTPEWQADLPRLWRGAWQRQKRGHWDTTLANAWGVLTAQRFAEKFQKEPVQGSVQAAMGEEKKQHDWKSPSGEIDFAWPEGAANLSLTQNGSGAPWAIVQSRAAIPLKQPLSTGYRVEKTITPVEVKGKGYARGDVWKIRLDIDAQSDMTWVAIDDPVPPGAMILGSGLGGDSALFARGQKRDGAAWLAYEEKRQDSYRAYYEYVPKGKFSLEYTIRLNTPGDFQMPTTRVEAMYAPEMFGELPNPPLKVQSP